jgi:hypothetical protein
VKVHEGVLGRRAPLESAASVALPVITGATRRAAPGWGTVGRSTTRRAPIVRVHVGSVFPVVPLHVRRPARGPSVGTGVASAVRRRPGQAGEREREEYDDDEGAAPARAGGQLQ